MQRMRRASAVPVEVADGRLRAQEVEYRGAGVSGVGGIFYRGIGKLWKIFERVGDEQRIAVGFDEVAAFDVVFEGERGEC